MCLSSTGIEYQLNMQHLSNKSVPTTLSNFHISLAAPLQVNHSISVWIDLLYQQHKLLKAVGPSVPQHSILCKSLHIYNVLQCVPREVCSQQLLTFPSEHANSLAGLLIDLPMTF